MPTTLPSTAPPIFEPSLNIPYETAVNFVRIRLSAFAHGGLKAWVTGLTSPAPSYNYVVALKNNTLFKVSPHPVQRLLQEMGYPTYVLKMQDGEGNNQFTYQFADLETYKLFQDQEKLLVENMSSRVVVSITSLPVQ